jgi:hypothetical protein
MDTKVPARGKKLTIILAVIAAVLVLTVGIIVLLKGNIFASLSTTPQLAISASAAKGANKMVFTARSNVELSSAYIWWNCNLQTSDDTKAEIISRCGTPSEKVISSSGGYSNQGDINAGARVKVFGTQASYKITFSTQKSNANAVAYVDGPAITGGLIATKTYTSNPNRTVTPYKDTNYDLRVLNQVGGTRYIAEKLDDADGSLPARRYYLWYNCSLTNLPITVSYSTVAATCGANSKRLEIPGDRLAYLNPVTETGQKNMVIIIQEKECPTFSYKGDSTCVFKSNLLAGNLAYTIIPKTPTPTPTPTLTATKTCLIPEGCDSVTPIPSPSPSRTPVPSPSPSVSAVIIGGDVDINNDFHRGWTAYGTTSMVDTTKYGANGLTILGFNGDTNSWYTPPGTGTYAIPGFTQTESGRAYYVFSSTAKTVSLPFRPVPTTVYTLTKGWNMLYNLGDKTLSTLQLKYNSVTNTAANMISSGVINPNIFIIEDDQASASCNYFSLLSSTASAADCSTGAKAHVITLPSGKVFWIKVN